MYNVYMYVCVYSCVRVFMHVDMYVYACVCTCARNQIQSMCVSVRVARLLNRHSLNICCRFDSPGGVFRCYSNWNTSGCGRLLHVQVKDFT